MSRLGVDLKLHVLMTCLSQCMSKIFQTLPIAHRITFAANYQQRQARVDLFQVGRLADFLQPAEQIEP